MSFSNWIDSLEIAFREIVQSIYANLPRLAGALLVLLFGFALGKGIRFLVERLLRRMEGLLPARVLGEERGAWGAMVVRVVGSLAFWLVLLFAAGAATEVLGFSALTGGLSGFAGYVPRLIAAVLVALAGMLGGNLAASWIRASARSAGIAYGESAARAARALVITVASVIALAQAGIDSTLMVVAVSTLLGAFLGAVALAFGLGARATVANIIGAHYVQRAYKVNQRIRIGKFEGRILEFRPTGVLLDANDGVTLIPASRFSDETTVLLAEETS